MRGVRAALSTCSSRSPSGVACDLPGGHRGDHHGVIRGQVRGMPLREPLDVTWLPHVGHVDDQAAPAAGAVQAQDAEG